MTATGAGTIRPRVRSRSETATVERLVGERTGIVSEVEFDHPPRDDDSIVGADISTASVGELLPQDTETEPDPEAGGKGRTVAEGVQTAVGEFTERYCALWPSEVHDYRTVEATYADLAASDASVPDFGSVAPFDPETVREFGAEPFDRTTEVEWAAGTDLIDGDEEFVPVPLVSLGEATGGDPYFFTSSNGLACGPDLASALVGAIYESVERDAVMRSWYRQDPPTRLSLDEWPALERERRRLGNDFGDYRLCRFETDSEFHTLGAVYVDERERAPKFLFGAAADLDFEAAVRDALVEATQGLRSMKTALAYDGPEDVASPNVLNLDENFKYYMYPENFDEVSLFFEGPREVAPDRESRTFPTPERELDACLDALDAVGATPIAYDLTTAGVEETGLRVARVVAPELVSLCPPGLPPVGHPALADDELVGQGHPFP
ncbi:YcaO-like family protein [Halorussus sp. MSC15.2]|uniref:YcaO-like family protein n=1 Tax=Halorussus sp. MSC15.2 TaxID=2283638 RepID=UPI0013D12293|nr:YcaO-like family protein [Halorussus sp. MSC15.2]NEU57122.1 hypothetical protein [Halorussus sp. MSC15.2]